MRALYVHHAVSRSINRSLGRHCEGEVDKDATVQTACEHRAAARYRLNQIHLVAKAIETALRNCVKNPMCSR